jgi:hypothetical protein
MGAFGKCNGGGRRRAARESFPCSVVYRTLLSCHHALLTDISSSGARLSGDALPHEGEDLVLTLEGSPVFGTVAWWTPEDCGIAFDEPLSPTILAAIKQRLSTARNLGPQLLAALDDWQCGVAR